MVLRNGCLCECLPHSELAFKELIRLKELITGHVPYKTESNVPEYILNARVHQRIIRGELPDRPGDFDDVREWLWQNICTPCWIVDPQKRLSAEEAVQRHTEDDNTGSQKSSRIALAATGLSALLLFSYCAAFQ